MNNLPIFRAKKINSDEYVFGIPRQDSKGIYEMIINVVEDGVSGVIQRYIEVDTISIHFPDMIDSQGNKIFASLQEDGKGGDIVKNDICFLGVVRFENQAIYYGEFKKEDFYSWTTISLIGLQE